METKYTKYQMDQLMLFAKENKLTIEEAMDYGRLCHHCGSEVGLCDNYCNERCQDYSIYYNYPCFRGNLCKLCPNGSWEPTQQYIIEPSLHNNVYEKQIWSKKISQYKTIKICFTLQCSWGKFAIEITDNEKNTLLEDISYLNTRNLNISVIDLCETGNTYTEILDKSELTHDEIKTINEELDAETFDESGWKMNEYYYEIDNGYTLDKSIRDDKESK